jgi:urease accessory protein
MLNLREVMTRNPGDGLPVGATVTLSFDQRRRSRLLVTLDDGREAALRLPRGTVLLDGCVLDGDDDETGEALRVRVRAAAETLSIARSADMLLLARAAYHLGNRHVPLEIGAGWVAYEHDHVLDGMVRELGLVVDTRVAPFEPEVGGYRAGGAAAHDHVGASGHIHRHSHDA